MTRKRYKGHSGVTMSEDEVFTRWALPILATLVIFIASGAVWAEHGIKDNQHRESIPAHVTMLAADLYLLEDGAPVAATDICLNGANGAPPVTRNLRVKGLNADLVDCVSPQQWNVKAGPPQSFIPDGIVHTALSPWVWIAEGVLFLLFFPWAYMLALRDERHENERARKAGLERLEEKRALLIAQWAKSDSLDMDDPGYISERDFESAMAKIEREIGTASRSTPLDFC